MALTVYERFPGNYWWSLMVLNALGMGGELSEIEPVAARLEPLAARPIGPTEQHAWSDAWHELGLRTRALGDRDLADGLTASARRKLLRAAAYMFVAEVVDSAHTQDPRAMAVYADAQSAFRDGVALEQHRVEHVEITFEGSSLPAILVPPEGVTGPAPWMVHFDGKDDVREVTYLRHRDGLARRGIGLLIVDHPGSGEAVRRRGLVARPDIETAASAAVDALVARRDVDPDAIGIIAQSFGGYYAPRAAAFEKRLCVCVVWGAIWDVAAVVAETGHPVEPAQWQLFGPLADGHAVERRLAEFTLEPVIDRLTCALLVLHGAGDRQVPLWAAERTVRRAVNASSKQLRVFGADEHGDEHCQLDLATQATDFIADWLARFFSSDTRGARP